MVGKGRPALAMAVLVAGITMFYSALPTYAIGTDLFFDGVDDCFVVPYSGSLPSTTFSVAAWVNAFHTPYGMIVSRGEDDSTDHLPWNLHHVDGRLVVQLEDSADVDMVYNSGVFIADREWHHVAATRESGGLLSMYVDGINVYTETNTLLPADNTQKLTVGCSLQGVDPGPQSPGVYLEGRVDDVTVWNRALTPAEIVALFQAAPDPGSVGLVGYWRFDEGAGQVGSDSSQQGNHGTLGFDGGSAADDPTWSTFPSECTGAGTGLRFDGINDCFVVPYSTSFPSSTFSASAWISAPQSFTSGQIVARNEDEATDNSPWALFYNAAGKFGVQLEDAGDVDLTYVSDSVIADGQWHHVVATRSSSGLLSLYVDGSSVLSVGGTLIPSPNNMQSMTVGCFLGSGGGPQQPQPPSTFLEGVIDDVTVWDRELSAAEVEALYLSPPDTTAPGLIALWQFDDGTGQIGADSSPWANDGTLGFDANPEGAADDPTWTGGYLDTLTLAVTRDLLSWNTCPPYTALGYDVVRGDLEGLRTTEGNYTLATEECLADDHTGSSIDYATSPDPERGFWFLARGVPSGTYDSNGPGQAEARDDEIDASASACP